VVAVDDGGVLDQALEPLYLSLDESLLVLGVLVFGVLGEVTVFFGVVDTLGDLLAPDVDQLLEFRSELGQTLFRDVLSLVVHRGRLPFSFVRPWPAKLRHLAARDKEKNSRRTALDALKFDRRVS
jgi:hypothetical protein